MPFTQIFKLQASTDIENWTRLRSMVYGGHRKTCTFTFYMYASLRVGGMSIALEKDERNSYHTTSLGYCNYWLIPYHELRSLVTSISVFIPHELFQCYITGAWLGWSVARKEIWVGRLDMGFPLILGIFLCMFRLL